MYYMQRNIITYILFILKYKFSQFTFSTVNVKILNTNIREVNEAFFTNNYMMTIISIKILKS